jgi:tetratricopeptide (TPR) repeat protein
LDKAIELLQRLIKTYPENAQARLSLAEIFLAQKQYDRALEVYQRMEKSFAKNAEIPRLMGKVYVEKRDTNQARAEFERSLAVMPDYLPTLQNITDFDILETNFAQAHQRLASVIERDPKSADLYAMQGKVYFYQKQTNQAEAAYSKAIELNPQFPGPYMDLARLYLGSHQEQQALDRLNALVARTNDVSALQEIGEIHQSAGRYDQARDAYEKILAGNPTFGPALNNLAYLYSEHLGNLDKALQLADTFRNLSPTDPNAADTLGWILFQKHEYARALNLIQESAEKQPNDPEVQMHLGMAYYMMEEEDPARVALNQAIKPGPDFPGRDLARRRLEVLNIDPTKATPAMVQQLQDLVQADPQDPVPLSRLAAIEEQRGEIEKAVQSLQTLISINPQNWPAMLRLARLEADHLKDIRKALELAQSAHVLASDDGQASALLGELAYRTGDYPWAKSLLDQAANQSPNDASVLYRLALACYAVGQVADADTAMKKAVQSGHSFPELDQAKQFLTLRAAIKDASQAQASSAHVQQILDKDPNDVPALMVSALLAQQHGAGNAAAQIWEKVLTIYRQFAPAMRELAIYYGHSQNASDRDKAYEWAQKARSSLPDDLELAKTLGLLAYDHGEYDRSMRLLRDYVEKSSKDGEAYFYLGMDYYKLKKPKEDSKQALQTALNLRVADNLAANAQTVLKELK